MKTTIQCLLIALALRVAFDAAGQTDREVAEAGERLVSASDVSQRVVHSYAHNSALPYNFVELYPGEDPSDLIETEPKERAPDLPEDFVLVGVVQQGVFVGYVYLAAEEVNELHLEGL
jgi:hypothetical protein